MYRGRSYGSSGDSLPLWVYIVIIVVFVGGQQIIANNMSDGSAVRAAEAIGYTNITVTDRHTFFPGLRGCDKSDMVAFEVTGTDPRGVERSFIVCDGIFKAATSRFN